MSQSRQNPVLDDDGQGLLGRLLLRARKARDDFEIRMEQVLSGPAQILRRVREVLRTTPLPERSLCAGGDDGALRVAAILDDFTQAAILPECDLILFGPDDFREVITRSDPHFLLVESCWNGNGGRWKGLVGHPLARLLDGRLEELLRFCRRQGIPTVFWNKDDPIHLRTFLPVAQLFDHVFTTDSDCVPVYQQRLRHDNIHVLPFFAQPRLHHPVLDAPRENRVCFAGSYFADREGRQAQLENLLVPAIPFGLDIFDRNHGQRGLRALRYRFPRRFQSCIRGGLSYPEMVEAYRRYRVVLNANTVSDSPTMFSRRVAEALACGTPVVSTPCLGIERVLGKEAVCVAETAQDTHEHLARLTSDDDAWARQSLRGLRAVLQANTCADRLATICTALNLPAPDLGIQGLGCLVPIRERRDLKWFGSTLDRQLRLPEAIWIVGEPPVKAADLEVLRLRFPEILVLGLPADVDAEQLLPILHESGVDWVAGLRPGNYYGPSYLLDYSLAARFAREAGLGKASHFKADAEGQVQHCHAGQEYCRVDRLPAASAMLRLDALSVQRLRDLMTAEELAGEPGTFLSLDHFSFVAAPPGRSWKRLLDRPIINVDV